jgi:hypothetical protein
MRAMHNGENFIESRARALSGRACASVFNLTTGQYRNSPPTKPHSASQIYAVSLLTCEFTAVFCVHKV